MSSVVTLIDYSSLMLFEEKKLRNSRKKGGEIEEKSPHLQEDDPVLSMISPISQKYRMMDHSTENVYRTLKTLSEQGIRVYGYDKLQQDQHNVADLAFFEH